MYVPGVLGLWFETRSEGSEVVSKKKPLEL